MVLKRTGCSSDTASEGNQKKGLVGWGRDCQNSKHLLSLGMTHEKLVEGTQTT